MRGRMPGPGPALLLLLACCWGIEPADAVWQRRLAYQPGNVLVDFLAYRHISVVHFDVPENAVAAAFKFTAKEEKTGGIGDCHARDVTIHMKAGSLPLVRPDGSRIEAKLLERRRRHYTVSALSNGDEHVVNIAAPAPGDWYVIAYRSWFDPNSGKIKQQGLGASCDTVLDAELSIEAADLLYPLGHRNSSGNITTELSRDAGGGVESAIIQFRVPRGAEEAVLAVRSSCAENCSIALHVTAGDHVLGRIVNETESLVRFRPYDDESVHYLTLRLLDGASSNLSVDLGMVYGYATSSANLTEIRLARKSLPDFFLFDYQYLADNGSEPVPMNLTAGSLSVLRFKVGAVYDTGGTLSVGLRFADEERDNRSKERMVVVGCVSFGYYAVISPSGSCVRDSLSSPADIFVANRTSPAFVHVPYPEPGLWHLSLRAYRLDDGPDGSTPCDCLEQCALNGTGCAEECECAQEWGARVESSVASSPCIEGGCNSHGRCVHYMSGGFVFSACHCSGGYRGFDCVDNEYVLSKASLLARLLLLTLSNLAFVGAIYVAIRRYYYTEAIVYSAVMFFSTFYHACEAGEEDHSFCLMKLNVLQFCDFYNALLSIWVTLVAMASMGERATSFCQMLGVVVLAVGAEMDRTSLWVFLLPTVSGFSLVISVWIIRCRQKGYYAVISPSGSCVRDSLSSPADIFVANRTSPAFVHVPYPEPGLWHLSLRAYRLDDGPDGSTPCDCLEQCALNGTGCAEECECAQEWGARVESSVASSPCIEGGCNSHGRCVHYMSGGFVFSACHCSGGYRGFDCVDNEYVLSKASLLARLLLLTLSNLAFVGAIYVAIRRYYYTEAIVYSAVMFFSTFYHACEAGEEDHSFCLMKLNVLQFCDFYNALLSIWVTLVAMASMGERATSFCQMLGVVVLAVGAEMDRTSLWVFLLPTVSGFSLVISVWIIRCRQKGTFQYPSRVYRLVYLPIGLAVVLVGLACYAFLQTRSNYYIVHSLWHVCVAAGVVLLLPGREHMQ